MKIEHTIVFREAIQNFGASNQMDMAVEECAELIQAINKLKRANLVHATGIKKPDSTMLLNEIEAYNNLCAEIADVKIMLGQLECMLCPETIQISFNRKMTRLEQRIINKRLKSK